MNLHNIHNLYEKKILRRKKLKHKDIYFIFMFAFKCFHPEVLDSNSEASTSATDSGGPKRMCRESSSNEINQALLDYIISDLLPFNSVESSSLQNLLSVTARRKITVMSRPTLTKLLNEKYDTMVENVKETLKERKHLCMTVDCWTSHHRSYLGATCHWLNDDLQREFRILSCRRIHGSHTFDVLAKEIDAILKQYNISDKVKYIVTDNAANFVKTFRLATQDVKDLLGSLEDESNDSPHVRELFKAKNIKISDILLLNNESFITLPMHIRCASHTINLVCTTDFINALKTCRYKELSLSYENLEKKCSVLWRYQNQSSIKADFIKNKLGRYLTTPGVTRWNSLYDSFCDILGLIRSKKNEFNVVCDYMKVNQFSDEEVSFLQNFCDIYKPLASALDILQGESECFIGILIPVICKVIGKLESFENSGNNASGLATILKEGVTNRFSDACENFDFLIATTLHPQFKMSFVRKNFPERGDMVEKFIISRINSVLECVDMNTQSQNNNQASSFWDSDYEDDQNSMEGQKIFLEYNFSTDKTTKIFQNKRFSVIKKLFTEYNTALPSSASVERLFSIGKVALTPNRCRLNDENFERQVILHINDKNTQIRQ